MTSAKARQVRTQGHEDALAFAKAIGVDNDYQNNPKAKKDVIDKNGDSHSVKSGSIRWQLFLYRKHRVETDDAFLSMNGIGQLLMSCLNLYPATFEAYQSNKAYYKTQLQRPMRELCEKFQETRRVRTFLHKAIFNGGEVDYLTIKYEDKFHVFLNTDVVDCFSKHFAVENSQARKPGDTPAQKVVFKYNKNVAELEIRNSKPNHYREILFVMNKRPAIELLFSTIKTHKILSMNTNVILYGRAIKKFCSTQYSVLQ